MCSVGYPCVIPSFILWLYFFGKNRATIADNVVAFRGTVCQWYAEPEYPDEMRIRPHPGSGSTVYSETGFIQLPFVWENWMLLRELCLQGST